LPISVGSDVSCGTSTSSSGSSSDASTANSTSSSSSSGSSITISDMGSLEVEVSVSEADITSVAVEQTATVTFDAISDTTFEGTVRSISPNGTTSSGVVSYTVRLSLKNPDGRLKPAMTATADIATQVATDVVTVPSAAVKTDNGSKYVVVVKNGVSTNQNVTVGVSDDTNTEIKTGVSQGDTVVTGSTTTASTTSSSSTKSGGGAGMMLGGGTGGPPSGGPGN
jgi:RND family efflux transporter MFP subunit